MLVSHVACCMCLTVLVHVLVCNSACSCCLCLTVCVHVLLMPAFNVLPVSNGVLMLLVCTQGCERGTLMSNWCGRHPSAPASNVYSKCWEAAMYLGTAAHVGVFDFCVVVNSKANNK